MTLGHTLCAIFQDPAWSAAVAAWLGAAAAWFLLVVAGVSALYAVPAAIAAAKTFQLESNPVILIREKLLEEPLPQDIQFMPFVFVVDGMPLIADGIELREETPGDISHPNWALTVNKHVILILRNAGRSAALAVRIPFEVQVPVYLGFGERDPESHPSDIGCKKGSGAITLPGIGPGETVCALLQNLVGNAVTLTAASFGTCTRIEGGRQKEHPMAIIALRDITLPSA